MMFAEWLQNQTERQDPIGDLASDAQHDERPKPTENSLKAWRSFLLNANACQEALAALHEAWKEYKLT